jgi:predicted enzyme related to lactoylglutathione lyase
VTRRREEAPMANARIAFIMYPVSDMARSTAFYADVLGLKKDGIDQPYWIEFDVAGTTFGIGNFEQVGTPGTAQSLALEVADLTAFRASLAARGVASNEPFETPICWISGVRDPDGNAIVLHQAKAPQP